MDHLSGKGASPALQTDCEYLYEKAKEHFGHDNVMFDVYRNYRHADDRFYTSDSLSKIKDFLKG